MSRLGPAHTAMEALCTRCGLCCNGVIFADVRLHSRSEVLRLKQLGLEPVVLRPSRVSTEGAVLPRFKLPQPCAALAGCHCRIYADRPDHCRAFECLLFKNVQAGRVKIAAAFAIVRAARARVTKVENLLRELGDRAEHLPLRARFKQLSKRIESDPPGPEVRQRYAELTVAMHQLNELLRDAFYR